MKKLISLLLVLVMVLSFAACASKAPEIDKSQTAADPTEPTPTEPAIEAAPTEPAKVTETENVTVDGLYVDTSYVDDEGPLKMVYLFLTIDAKDSNTKVDCLYTKMNIGANSYDSEFYKGSCKYMPNYYYSSFVEDVYIGEQIKIVLTFKVPEGDLTGGKDITFTDTSMPVNDLKMSTDDIIACDSIQAIGELVDSEGCALEAALRQPASEETVQNLRYEMNGYYWTFYVSAGTSVMTYELEFYSPNSFEVRTPYLSNTGTYDVMEGYIFLTYDNSTDGSHTIEIPYWFDENGELNLNCALAYSIYE